MSASDSESLDIEEQEESWSIGCSAIPEKSKFRYENTFKIFKKWCEAKNINSINEKKILEYFVQRTKQLKAPGSLWAEYSMLKTTILLYDSVDISKFETLIAYIKRKNVGYRPKKASVFTKEDITTFLNEAPDEEFLIYKVGMILGISGACKREELYNMTINDIEEHEGFMIVKIPNTKTNTQRSFTVINKQDEKIHYLDIFRKYFKLRPSHVKSDHLFLNYHHGKCSGQVVGKGSIGSWAAKIAKYLNLQNPDSYTGHSFRRTSLTLLANKGVDVLGLKRHDGWHSCTVAESYVEDTHQDKKVFAEKILHHDDEMPLQQINTFTSETVCLNNDNIAQSNGVSFNNCSNCTFNINITK